MLRGVQAVQAFEAFTGLSYFSVTDLWHFISISDIRRCQNCELFDGKDFYGDQLRTMFPDLEIINEYVINANVHLTLWGKPTCRCKLIRVFSPNILS